MVKTNYAYEKRQKDIAKKKKKEEKRQRKAEDKLAQPTDSPPQPHVDDKEQD